MKAADQFAVVDVTPGALLLLFDSGALFQLNATAAFVWRLRRDGADPASIAEKLSVRYGLERQRASRDVDAILTIAKDARPSLARLFSYERSPRGYIQTFNGHPAVEVDEETGELESLVPVRDRRRKDLRNHLRTIVPNLLALRGHTVLHASAISVRGRLIAFLGRSGAGKTTTARALAGVGAEPVAEDKLVIQIGPTNVVAFVDGERHVDVWIKRSVEALMRGEKVSCVALDDAATGDTRTIDEIGFIAADLRTAGPWSARALSPLEAAATMFSAAFLGSDRPPAWVTRLESVAAVANVVPCYDVRMPSGLLELNRAASDLTNRSTLRSG